MKKILLSIVSAGMFVSLYGQTSSSGSGFGIEAGIRGAAASNWLFNTNVSNSPNEAYSAAFSYNYGLDAAIDLNEHIAIEANLLFETMTQGYSGNFGSNESNPQETFKYGYGTQVIANGESYTASTKINVMSIPLLFRFGSGNGAYIELGPEYQIVQKALYSVTYSSGPSGYPTYTSSTYPDPNILDVGVINHSKADVTKAFAGSNIVGILGFGDDFQLGSSGLHLITNLRFYYGFTDLVGVDAHGQDLHTTWNGNPNPLYNANLYPYQPNSNGPYYASYKATHLAGASFNIGLYYYIGFNGATKGNKAPSIKN